MLPLGTWACSLLLATLAVTTQGLTLNTKAEEDPWPTMRGPPLHQFGSSSVVVPKNLSEALLWSFHHPAGRYASVICGGPVIDAEHNLYLSMNDGVRKLSPDGKVLWHYDQPHHRFNNQVSLHNGKVFSSNEGGVAFSLDQRTGEIEWQQKMADGAGGDCGYPAAYDGVFVMASKTGTMPKNPGGNQIVFGLAANTGERLWEYRTQLPVWNFEPLFTEDGNVVFMDFAGNMYSLGLHTGRLNWMSPALDEEHYTFTDGGSTLGPNGAVYACSNRKGRGTEGSQGMLRALQVTTGTELWRQTLGQPCNSYPAIGKLGAGPDLSVVVTPGSFMGEPRLHGSIMAFGASTGEPQWTFNTQPYTGLGLQARGDFEGFSTRSLVNRPHLLCLPAHWSSANIAGDGTVYAGRANGLIYAVRGVAQQRPADIHAIEFASTPGLQVQTWDAEGAFLHGAFAFAPGMMAAASCDTLYVFKA